MGKRSGVPPVVPRPRPRQQVGRLDGRHQRWEPPKLLAIEGDQDGAALLGDASVYGVGAPQPGWGRQFDGPFTPLSPVHSLFDGLRALIGQHTARPHRGRTGAPGLLAQAVTEPGNIPPASEALVAESAHAIAPTASTPPADAACCLLRAEAPCVVRRQRIPRRVTHTGRHRRRVGVLPLQRPRQL